MASPSKKVFVDLYLERIKYQGSREPTLEVLQALHRNHQLFVPFENFSNIFREKITLSREWLFEKIVLRRRGGFCFELNTSFAMLLGELGFQLTIAEAKVYDRTKTVVAVDYHAVLLVDIKGERWLADVGFGDVFTTPLKFVDNEEQKRDSGVYRIRKAKEGDNYRFERKNRTNEMAIVLQGGEVEEFSSDSNDWIWQYVFNPQPKELSELQHMVEAIQMSPSSVFNQGRICTVMKPFGRVTLSRNKLITSRIDPASGAVSREIRALQPEEDVTVILEKEFGIKLDGLGVNTLPPI